MVARDRRARGSETHRTCISGPNSQRARRPAVDGYPSHQPLRVLRASVRTLCSLLFSPLCETPSVRRRHQRGIEMPVVPVQVEVDVLLQLDPRAEDAGLEVADGHLMLVGVEQVKPAFAGIEAHGGEVALRQGGDSTSGPPGCAPMSASTMELGTSS